MRRVVVTGLGAVSPLGNGVDYTWRQLIAGKSGLGPVTRFDASDLPARVAGEVPTVSATQEESATPSAEGLFDPNQYLEKKEQRKMDQFMIYAIAAAIQAVEDSGWMPQDDESQERTGVIIGSGIGGLQEINSTSLTLEASGPRRVSPFFIPASLINLASGYVSIRYGFKGPNHAVVTACATGAHAIGDAARLIMFGDADVMIAGGAEATICRIGMAGFASARTLSTNFNETPEKASRPWDQDRDGFVMGEGSGILVLEEYEHAKKRGAKIYGEVAGYGLSGDAYHITAPAEDGNGFYRAMISALKHANLTPEDLGYINAHGTSTPLGDPIEVRAVKRLLGDHAKKVPMSSTKSAIGHLLGAAGSMEAIFALKALSEGILPPTLNLDNPSEGCDLDFIPHEARQTKVKAVMSNSFGFGGTNASLVFKAV